MPDPIADAEALPPVPPVTLPSLDLSGQRLTRTIVALAWPVLVERVAVSVLYTVAAVLVGRYVGANGIAAVGIAGQVLWLTMAGGFGVEVGTTAVVARDAGAGDSRRMQATAGTAALIGFLWGLGGAVVAWTAGPAIISALGAEGQIARYANDFLVVSAFGFPFMNMTFSLNGALRGLGNTFLPMVIIIAVNGVNAALAFLLISGVAGIEMETVGAGIAGAVSSALGCALTLFIIFTGRTNLALSVAHLTKLSGRAARRIFSVGLPVGLEEFQFMLAFLVYSGIIYHLGDVAQAAHSVGLRTLELAIVPGFALGTAATAIVGQYLGAERPDLAERAGLQVRNYALLTMLSMAAVMAAFAPWLPLIFVDEPDVVETSGRLLRVFALALPGMALHASLSGALRAGGDAPFVMATFTVTAWLVRIPVAALCALGLGWGAPGAWVGAAAENTVRGVIIWLRFRMGKWKTRKV